MGVLSQNDTKRNHIHIEYKLLFSKIVVIDSHSFTQVKLPRFFSDTKMILNLFGDIFPSSCIHQRQGIFPSLANLSAVYCEAWILNRPRCLIWLRANIDSERENWRKVFHRHDKRRSDFYGVEDLIVFQSLALRCIEILMEILRFFFFFFCFPSSKWGALGKYSIYFRGFFVFGSRRDFSLCIVTQNAV